jgi:hypothetical protein
VRLAEDARVRRIVVWASSLGRITSVPMSSLRRAPASASEGGFSESPLSDGPNCVPPESVWG